MKTYLQTSTSDPPLQGNEALAKHTLVFHHQGMFGCREKERKLKKMKKKMKSRELTVFVFPISQNSKVPKKIAILPHIGAYIEFFLGKIPLCPQKALDKEGENGKNKEKKIKK